MIYHNTAWIGVVIIVSLCGAALLGVLLASSDLLNWQTHGASAEATRTAVADIAAQNEIKRNATATVVAIEIKNKEIAAIATQTAIAHNLLVAPTQTAVSIRNQEQSQEATVALSLLSAQVTIVVLGSSFVGFLIFLFYRASLTNRVALKDAETRQMQQAERVVQAETERFKEQAEMIKEQRRHLEVVASIEQASRSETTALSKLISAPARGNGHNDQLG